MASFFSGLFQVRKPKMVLKHPPLFPDKVRTPAPVAQAETEEETPVEDTIMEDVSMADAPEADVLVEDSAMEDERPDEDMMDAATLQVAHTKHHRQRTTPTLAKQDKQRQALPFMKLPPELRANIYEEILTSPAPVIFQAPPRRSPKVPAHPRDVRYIRSSPAFDTALLRTSRTLAQEAAPILYGSHTFRFADVKPFTAFLDTIGPSNIRSLRHIELLCWTFVVGPTMPVFERLLSTIQLKTLVLSVGWLATRKTPAELARTLLPLMERLQKVQTKANSEWKERDIIGIVKSVSTEEANRRLGLPIEGPRDDEGDVPAFEEEVKNVLRRELRHFH